jgi:hypothetical protein
VRGDTREWWEIGDSRDRVDRREIGIGSIYDEAIVGEGQTELECFSSVVPHEHPILSV